MFSCEFCEISENSFSYRIPPLAASERVIWFSDKGLRERERQTDRQRERQRQRETNRDRDRDRERERKRDRDRQRQTDRQIESSKSTAVDRKMRSSRGDHSIDVPDNIYGCLSGLSCICFFKIMNFWDRSRQYFKLFTTLRRSCLWVFWNFKKNTLCNYFPKNLHLRCSTG